MLLRLTFYKLKHSEIMGHADRDNQQVEGHSRSLF